MTVYVDGLKGSELPQFTRGLRALYIETRKVRGIRRDENEPLIRLADAICGLVRDAGESGSWAMDLMRRFEGAGVLARV